MEKLYGSQLMKKGCNCAQSVLVSLAGECGIDEKTAMKLACPLGGGCRSGDICGALSAALIAIGLVNGNDDMNNKEAQQAAYAKYIEFVKRFKDEFGDRTCRGLLGVDTSTPNGHQFMAEHPEAKEKCFAMIDGVIPMVKEVIDEYRK